MFNGQSVRCLRLSPHSVVPDIPAVLSDGDKYRADDTLQAELHQVKSGEMVLLPTIGYNFLRGYV